MIRNAALLAIPLLAMLALAAGCGAPAQGPNTEPPLRALEQLLAEQTALYPLMAAEDLYKLLHQAVLGPSNLFMGRNSKLEIGLNAEIALMAPSPAAPEPLVEMLDPDRNLARVNLRPYLLGGGRAEDLARAVARTAHEHRGERRVLEKTLEAAADLLERLVVAIDRREFLDYAHKMKEKGYPAGNHSERYAKTYEPAYRIVYLQHLTDRDYGGRYLQPEELPR